MSTGHTEDYRVALARELLAEVEAGLAESRNGGAEYDYAFNHGQLREAVRGLLAVIDERAERDALLEAAANKPFDELMATVAEIEAEREAAS